MLKISLKRSFVYSVEIILLLLVLLVYGFKILKITIPWSNDLIYKTNEIIFQTYVYSLLNPVIKKDLFSYDFFNILLSTQYTPSSYFSILFTYFSYYDIIEVNSTAPMNKTIIFFYPFPVLLEKSTPYSFDNKLKLYDKNGNEVPFYATFDWKILRVSSNKNDLHNKKYVEIYYIFDKLPDIYSFYAYDSNFYPLKIVNLSYYKEQNSFIFRIYVKNFNSNVIYLVFRDNSTYNLSYLDNYPVYNINFNMPTNIDLKTDLFQAPWATIYANVNLKKGINIFYLYYTTNPFIKYNYTLNISKVSSIEVKDYKVFIFNPRLAITIAPQAMSDFLNIFTTYKATSQFFYINRIGNIIEYGK